MPTVNVNKELLCRVLGQNYTDEEFSELCFDYGLELDDVVYEKTVINKSENESLEKEEIIYKIDIPANRYDLLCVEGLSTALLTFQKKRPAPVYKRILDDKYFITVENRPNTRKVRPIVLAAVLRNVTLDADRYNSFIDLQDKLHHNICRKRTLVAIGTHDLDTVKPPFIYDAKPPSEIKFRALNLDTEHTAGELMNIYSTHAQLKQFLPIIKDSEVYPVIYDSEGTVLSLPPIINGYHSRITVNTKNIFIECTATDLTKATIVLDTIVCAFSAYCKEPFSIECCKIVSAESSEWYPQLKYRTECISVKKINKYLGLKISDDEMVSLLGQMSLKSKLTADKSLEVEIPPTRHDILHSCDIIEDVAIAVGYNNIPRTLPDACTVANQYSLNKLTEQLRHHIAYSGFAEALTFSLCSRDDISSKLRVDMKEIPAVHIANPKTLEFQVVRTTLLPGLLKTVSSNKQLPLPIKVFEVSDTVYKVVNGVGARNERYLCAVYYGKSSGFEIVHGLLDKIMRLLSIPKNASAGYSIVATNHATFFPERCAEIHFGGKKIGIMGIIHPEVLSEFELSLPCSCIEFSIEPFL